MYNTCCPPTVAEETTNPSYRGNITVLVRLLGAAYPAMRVRYAAPKLMPAMLSRVAVLALACTYATAVPAPYTLQGRHCNVAGFERGMLCFQTGDRYEVRYNYDDINRDVLCRLELRIRSFHGFIFTPSNGRYTFELDVPGVNQDFCTKKQQLGASTLCSDQITQRWSCEEGATFVEFLDITASQDGACIQFDFGLPKHLKTTQSGRNKFKIFNSCDFWYFAPETAAPTPLLVPPTPHPLVPSPFPTQDTTDRPVGLPTPYPSHVPAESPQATREPTDPPVELPTPPFPSHVPTGPIESTQPPSNGDLALGLGFGLGFGFSLLASFLVYLKSNNAYFVKQSIPAAKAQDEAEKQQQQYRGENPENREAGEMQMA